MNKKAEYFIPGFEDKIKEIKENDKREELNVTQTETDFPVVEETTATIEEVAESTAETITSIEATTILPIEELNKVSETVVTTIVPETAAEPIIATPIIDEKVEEPNASEPPVISEAVSVFSAVEDPESPSPSETISALDLEVDDNESLPGSTSQKEPETVKAVEIPGQDTSQHVPPQPIPISPAAEQQPNQNPPKKKKGLLIGLFSLLALLIIGGGITSYFVFFQKTEINPFDYIVLETEGVSGNAEAILSIDETALTGKNIDEVTRMTDFLSELTFDVSKEEGIANGDTVNISIDPADQAFADYRFQSANLSKDFKIEGLSTVPATWNDVTDKTGIDAKVAEQLQSTVDLYKKELNNIAQRDLGSSIDITINTTLQTTSYMVDLTTCTGVATVISPQMQCGTVAFVYKIDFVIPSNYQFTGDSTIYQTIFVSNIFEDNGEMNFSPYSNMLSSDYTGKDLTKIMANLADDGFVQV